jgi:hypothetical protein
MKKFSIGTGVIQTDQGGKLSCSNFFCETMLKDFGYVVKPTGADSPSPNGGAKIYNNTLAVQVQNYFMLPVSLLIFGQLPSSTPYTSTTGSFTLPPIRPYTRAGMDANPTSHTSKILVHGYV